jgi:hypothetical protein
MELENFLARRRSFVSLVTEKILRHEIPHSFPCCHQSPVTRKSTGSHECKNQKKTYDDGANDA